MTGATSSCKLPPRWLVSTLAAVRGVVLFAAAMVLPWSNFSLFAVELSACAAADFALALAIWMVRPSQWAALWRMGSWLALACLLHLSWQVVSAGVYLSGLYGSLGQGVAVAALVAYSGVLWVFLPFSWWGLGCTGGGKPLARWRRWSLTRKATSVALIFLAASWSLRATMVHAAGDVLSDREVALPSLRKTSAWQNGQNVASRAPVAGSKAARCAGGPESWLEDQRQVVLVGLRQANGEARVECWDFARETWPAALNERLQATPEAVFAVDVVASIQRLEDAPWPAFSPSLGGLVAMFALRPGLDGLCYAEHCLAPWQLVARSAFTQFRPIAAIHDLRMGVDFRALTNELAATASSATEGSMWRIATSAFTWSADGAPHALQRQRLVDGDSSPEAWQRAAQAAQRYIVQAQQADGSFTYLYDPLSGHEDRVSVSLPRHAGTTLALCELGEKSPAVELAIARALKWLAARQGAAGPWQVLYRNAEAPHVGLGEVALPLAAFARCRTRVGSEHDPLIHQLTDVVRAMQRETGSFRPRLDRQGDLLDGPSPLYAEGQAVLALIEVMRSGVLSAVQREGVATAVHEAMDYVAHDYWHHALSPFFFLEENWHCLAARAALEVARHQGYERFCLDYLAFKSRLILDQASDVASDFRGGYGFGNLVVPHVTPAAGFVEAAAAGVVVARASDPQDLPAIERLTRDIAQVLGFIAGQQWSDAVCGACIDPARARGGFAESRIAPVIRIDFVQHAWSALHYGASVQKT